MAVVAITGGPGAPGATSAALALLLSWPLTEHRRVLLVEADPDGGAVLAGALQGEVQADKGLRNLALSDRRGRLLEEMWDQCIDLSPHGTGDRLLLPGLTDPAQAAALVFTWEPLAEACRTLDGFGCDVIVDLGRSGGQGASAVLARRADAVLAVVRSTLRGLSSSRPRVAALAAELAQEGAADALCLLLVREGPYSAAEISRALGAPVVGLLPFAPKEARILSDGGGRTSDRRFQRSELMRSARSTGDELRALTARRRLVGRPPQAGPPAPPDTPSIPGPVRQAVASPYAPPAPPAPSDAPTPTIPLRVIPPAPPAPMPTPAAATHLGYRQAQAPAPEGRPATVGDPAPGSEPWQPWHDGVSATPVAGACPWPGPEGQPVVAGGAAGRPWLAYEAPAAGPAGPASPLGPAAPAPGSEPWQPWHDGVSATPVAGARPWPTPEGQPAGAGGAAGRAWSEYEAPAAGPAGPASAPGPVAPAPGSEPWSVRNVMDLAAAAELGARPPAPRGPAQSPIGPVTPGQAARLQAVQMEAGREPAAGDPFNPANMVVMPPLAEHAPRPPAPEEFRPADEEHGGGEVARVR